MHRLGVRSFPHALKWARPPWTIRWAAFALIAVLLATTSGDGLLGVPAGGTYTPRHRGKPAPGQRWGSAAGKGHLVGSPGNRAVPQSLRGQYPPHKLSDKPPAGHNTASVARAADAGRASTATRVSSVTGWSLPSHRPE